MPLTNAITKRVDSNMAWFILLVDLITITLYCHSGVVTKNIFYDKIEQAMKIVRENF